MPVWFCLLAVFFSAPQTALADTRIGNGNVLAGKEKSDAGRCQECHGADGNSGDLRIPSHAGQYAGYLVKQLRDFQGGARQHAVMTVMAEDLSEEDLADIAAYFASQQLLPGRDGSGKSSAAGLFANGDAVRDIPACAGCHGENGQGQIKDGTVYPRIGGQRKMYLHSQLVSWKLGERHNSPDGVMNKISKGLNDDEIDAMADYLSGL